MQYWTKRTTPQGKVYYGNSITHETTWDFDDINPANGRLVSISECIFFFFFFLYAKCLK